MTSLNVAENTLRVDELILGVKANVGFKDRQIDLSAQIDLLSGSVDSTLNVLDHVHLSLGTTTDRSSFVLLHNVIVASGASIHLPMSVSIEDSGRLDIVGAMTGVHNITVANGGVLKMASPVSVMSPQVGVVNLDILRVDFDGSLQHSSKGTNNRKVMLNVIELQMAPQHTLDTRYFDVSANTEQVELYLSESPLNYTCEADDDGDLHIFRGQFCYIENGTNVFRQIIIDSGAELRLEGDPSGVELTIIKSELVHIHPGGIVTGDATGFKWNGTGTGSGQTIGEAGSHGGLGGQVTNTSRLYGDMAAPREYGSNGFNGGRGGGQVEFIVSESFINSGVVTFNGEDSNEAGGSGGSILITAEAVTGCGIFRAVGGRGGGGGGRIAFNVKQTFEATFQGKVKVSGGSGSHLGASGTVYRHYCNSLIYASCLNNAIICCMNQVINNATDGTKTNTIMSVKIIFSLPYIVYPT